MPVGLRSLGASRRVALAVALAGLIVLLPGCGRSGRKPVYPVHGRVVDGENQPAVGALVIFHPVEADANDPNKPRAYVEADGSFALTTFTKGDGAPEGEYLVSIEWMPPRSNPFAANQQGADRLQGRYRDPTTSGLRFRVEKQPDNVLPSIQVR
jgi:hypothetical protein